jgi:hypothetical protein
MNQLVEDVERLSVNGSGPILVCGLELKTFEEGANSKWPSWLRETILVAHVNVFDADLKVFDDLCDEFFGKCVGGRIFWFWKMSDVKNFILKKVNISRDIYFKIIKNL